MRASGAVWLLLMLVGTGCSSTRVVHLKLEDGRSIVHKPLEEDGNRPVELSADEFAGALATLAQDVRPFANPLREARQRFGVPERSGMYLYESRSPRLIPLREEGVADGLQLIASSADDELTRAYGRWCTRKSRPSDCLRLLVDGPLLAGDGRYSLAMAIAMDSVWDETAEALKGMTDPQALLATVTASVSMYLLLWALPEPVSKGLAALLTVTAIAYLGVDTVWTLLDGWLTLVRQVDRASTFEQIHEAGEAYGQVLGKNAARIFVMLATAAIGNTAGLAAKATRLPGSAQATLVAESQAGYRFIAVGDVSSVAMTAEGFTLTLAPTALAMASSEMEGGHPQKHHLATIRNEKSTARGGPWTPEFRRIFKRAGMELKDPENIVEVQGHKGPHPQEYHELVFRRLNSATARCRTVEECRKALTVMLRKLAREASTPGTDINRLLTEGQAR